jgi:hypothetical protein
MLPKFVSNYSFRSSGAMQLTIAILDPNIGYIILYKRQDLVSWVCHSYVQENIRTLELYQPIMSDSLLKYEINY